jgi:hypothetical protein
MKLPRLLVAAGLIASSACHPGPLVDTGPKPPGVGGTIAGIVSTSGNAPVPTRKVTAIETTSGARFEAITGANGGYTIKVPEGTYRLEVELRPGESVAKGPDQTRINRSDLDPQRHFVIAVGKVPPSS